jgi:hypothetical protein
MAKISLDIDDKLFEDLSNKALANKLHMDDLIRIYVQQGLAYNEVDTVLMVCLNENVVEKVNIVSKLTDRSPEEVVNDTLWDNLRKIEDVPDEIDYEKIWNMLDHDKPEGDDVLDNLMRLGEEGWD